MSYNSRNYVEKYLIELLLKRLGQVPVLHFPYHAEKIFRNWPKVSKIQVMFAIKLLIKEITDFRD
jgi:hypothetical protein